MRNFDLSRHESVWVPDKYLREELEKIADPKERRAKAVKYAEQACEEYTAWSNGDCHGVVIQVHELDGALVESDECWGYIGYEHAEETLRGDVDSAAERWSHKAPQSDPNRMGLAL